MGSLSGVGIALCLVFGCILVAFVAAELYYFLWWKRRQAPDLGLRRQTSDPNPWSRTFPPFPFFRRKSSQVMITDTITNSQDEERGNYGNHLGLIKTYCGEEPLGVETELMRAHNLAGPPRFLFTIKEESREEMESDDLKSRSSRARSLSDVIFAVDGTPFLTPLSSPTLRTPRSTESFRINPLFEEEYYLDSLRSSPPPKLKFLKDAEDKFLRRFLEEKRGGVEFFGMNKSEEDRPWNCCNNGNVRTGSFVSLISKGQGGSAQVLPLSSSPTTLHSTA